MTSARASFVAFALACLSWVGADASAVQDSCRTDGDDRTVYFSIVNETSQPVCQMTIFPFEAQCLLVDCGAPDDWSCFPGNVTTFWFADSNAACIPPGGTLHGFRLGQLTDFCCFGVNLFGADGMHLGSKDACFDCAPIGVEPRTWGHVKSLFE